MPINASGQAIVNAQFVGLPQGTYSVGAGWGGDGTYGASGGNATVVVNSATPASEMLPSQVTVSCNPSIVVAPQTDRIFELLQRFPLQLDPMELRSFTDRCAKQRNDISHEGGQRPGEDAESFRWELRDLAEALRYLFHALLLHEVGLNKDLLLKAFIAGGIGSARVVRALREVGISIARPSEEGT